MAVLTYDRGTLLIEGADRLPEGWRAELEGLEFVPDRRVGALRGPASVWREVSLLAQDEPDLLDDRARDYGKWSGDNLLSRFDPWPHQAAALDAFMKAGGRGVIVLPTGTGKTFLALMILTRLARDALVVVPTLDLMAQWIGVLRSRFNIPVGSVGGGEHDIQPITVITYDSAARKIDRLGNRFGVLVFDECHHLGGPIYQTIAEMSLAPFRLGLTATLERPDGGHDDIQDRIGPVVYDVPVRELSGKVLAEYHTARMEVDLSPDEWRRYEEARLTYLHFCRRHRVFSSRRDGWGRFLTLAFRSAEGRAAWEAYRVQKEIPLTCRAKKRVLANLLLQHREDRILIFTHLNELAYEISRTHLLPVITHQTPPTERADILEGFLKGRYKAVVTSKVLNEGVDVPAANVAVVVSGSGSQREHIQRLGRILRKGDGGKRAVLYELVTRDTNEEKTSRRRRARSYFC